MNEAVQVKIPALKRFFDIILSLFFLAILSPFIAVIFILFKLEQAFKKDSRGPFLYSEVRISEGKPFLFYKIRTCKVSAYELCRRKHGTVHTAVVESDKTNFLRTGWIVKQIYLDEIPQLFNVLIGDISLVGPRPKPVKEYEDCLKQGNFAKKYIKAGLTGPFQSYKGNWKDGMDDLSMDKQYLNFVRSKTALQVLFNDLLIIFRTFKVILEHRGI